VTVSPVATVRDMLPVRVIPSFDVACIMDRLGWDHIDFLKIDVESAEKYVFSNTSLAGNWLPKVSCLSIELHERFKAGCCEKPVHDAMREHGFEYKFNSGELEVYCKAG
jgi:hypothetical protein